MLRTTSRFARLLLKPRARNACALLSLAGASALVACSPGASSGDGGSGAGTSAAGAPSSNGGSLSSTAGASNTSGGTSSGTAGASGTTAVSGGMSGGGAAAGGASSVGGSAGGSSGGSTGSAGSNTGGAAGLGGTTNPLGTISGSPAIAALLALTKNCTTTNEIPNSHTYKLDNGMTTSICSLKGGTGNAGGAIYYTADMDIDCDGITTAHCPGTGADMDCCYQDQTSFHGPNSASNKDGMSLASENTPYVVIPQDVQFPGLDQNSGGNIIAVIYNNQLEFGVFGDQGPTDIIGEASVRTANGLGIPASPATGGVGGGVTYIVFVGTGSTPADMENIPQIQALGAQLTESLLKNNP